MLEIKNLTKKYRNKIILEDINIALPDKFICGLIGDNGVGKTTFIKSIFADIKINSGEVFFNGTLLKNSENIKKIALFPDLNNLVLSIKLLDYLTMIGLMMKKKKHDLNEDIQSLAKSLEMEEHLNKKIKSLSSGLKKKAILMSILIQRPEIIILDEPTSNLDINSKNEFLSLLLKIYQQGISLIITSHQIEELQEFIDYLIFLDDKVVKFNGPFDCKKQKIMDIYNEFSSRKEMDVDNLANFFKKK